MKHIKSIVSTLLISGFVISQAQANTTNSASELVGKYYWGGHAAKYWADNERLATPMTNSNLDKGNGLGIEFGKRLSESLELRFSFTDFSIDAELPQYGDVDGTSIAVDALYFPTKENLYLVVGASKLKMESSDVSTDLGIGYRHYVDERSALYLEGKSYHQFRDGIHDYSAQIGFIYFFGEASKPAAKIENKLAPVAVKAPAPTNPKKPVITDSDSDGVIDSKDQCPNSAETDKVDSNGCTVFTEENSTMALLINFDNNKAIVKNEYFSEVERAANFLKQHPHINLTIEGHSSSVGNAKYNKTLSQKRANAVVELLKSNYGIDGERLTAKGYGEERLLDDANNEMAHSKNRRIQATVVVKEKVAVKK